MRRRAARGSDDSGSQTQSNMPSSQMQTSIPGGTPAKAAGGTTSTSKLRRGPPKNENLRPPKSHNLRSPQNQNSVKTGEGPGRRQGAQTPNRTKNEQRRRRATRVASRQKPSTTSSPRLIDPPTSPWSPTITTYVFSDRPVLSSCWYRRSKNKSCSTGVPWREVRGAWARPRKYRFSAGKRTASGGTRTPIELFLSRHFGRVSIDRRFRKAKGVTWSPAWKAKHILRGMCGNLGS